MGACRTERSFQNHYRDQEEEYRCQSLEAIVWESTRTTP